jgi:ElaB/YqjD/DUF883 family membrane-anchored ribosome-binding protein
MATTPEMAPNPRKTGNGSRASSTAKSAAARISAAEAAVEEQTLEAQVSQLQADLKAITETLGKLTGSKVGEARAIAKTEMRHLQQRGEQMLNDAQDQAGEAEKQLKDTIREKPLTAVATAAGIGFVLALLTRH